MIQLTRYEELLAQYENECDISEHVMESSGLYCDSHIWINKGLSDSEKLCVLAEEIGHHYTNHGDILDQSKTANIKQERLARKYGYNLILSVDDVYRAVRKGYTDIWDIADYLDIPESYLREYLELIGIESR